MVIFGRWILADRLLSSAHLKQLPTPHWVRAGINLLNLLAKNKLEIVISVKQNKKIGGSRELHNFASRIIGLQ